MKFEISGRPVWRTLLGVVLCGTAFAVAAPASAGTDSAFLSSAVAGGTFEVQVGQLAERNGSNHQVKLLGHIIASDHTERDGFLRQLASMQGVNASAESATYSRQLQQLENLHGAAFDKAFLQTITANHKADIDVYLQEANNGKNIAIKQFASTSLATLQKHLSMAKQLRSEMGW